VFYYVDGWDVRELSYVELRWLCRELGLSVSGAAEVLRARLLSFKQFPSRFGEVA